MHDQMKIRYVKYEEKGSMQEILFKFNSPLVEPKQGSLMKRICQEIGFNMLLDTKTLFAKFDLNEDEFYDYLGFYRASDDNPSVNKNSFFKYYAGEPNKPKGKREQEFFPILIELLQDYYITAYMKVGKRNIPIEIMKPKYEVLKKVVDPIQCQLRIAPIIREQPGLKISGLNVKCDGVPSNECSKKYRSEDGSYLPCLNCETETIYEKTVDAKIEPCIENLFFRLGNAGYNLLTIRHDFFNIVSLGADIEDLERIVTFNRFMYENGLNFTSKYKQPPSHRFFICENNEIYYFKKSNITETEILRELQQFVYKNDGSMLNHNELRAKFKSMNMIDIDTINLNDILAVNFMYEKFFKNK